MADLHDLLERSAARYTPPPDLRARVSERSRERQRNRRVATGLAAVLVVAGIVGVLAPLRPPSSPIVSANPSDPYVGTWVSTDIDGSSQTMDISAVDATYEIVLDDDSASVCSGVPATMTGTGRLDDGFGVVISSPTLECSDGTTPVPLDGSSLEDVLRDFTFVHDPATDALTDSVGITWLREGTSSGPATSESLWPLYGVLDGRVTFSARPSWEEAILGPNGPDVVSLYLSNQHDQLFTVVGDPFAPTGSCEGTRPTSADEFVDVLRSGPDLSVSSPVSTRVGSIDAVQLDITSVDGAARCSHGFGGPGVSPVLAASGDPASTGWWGVDPDTRARLYVFEVPGTPAHTLAILVSAPQHAFEDVLTAAEPVLESFKLAGDG